MLRLGLEYVGRRQFVCSHDSSIMRRYIRWTGVSVSIGWMAALRTRVEGSRTVSTYAIGCNEALPLRGVRGDRR